MAAPMQRIPEPELMEGSEQARAYAEADFEAPHRRFVELFREKFPRLDVDGHVLDLGCGPGDIALRFAAAYPRCVVHGVDGSEAMLACAEICHRRHPGLRDRVLLLHGRLPDCALPRTRYDAVICNSLLHHLPDPAVQWRSVNRWAAPGAPVFVVDLRRPPSRAEAQRLTDLYAAGEPDVLRHDFHHSLLAAFEPDEIRAQLRAAGLAHLQVDVPSDRHVVIWGTAR